MYIPVVELILRCPAGIGWIDPHNELLPKYSLLVLGPSSGICKSQKRCDLFNYITTFKVFIIDTGVLLLRFILFCE